MRTLTLLLLLPAVVELNRRQLQRNDEFLVFELIGMPEPGS